MNYCTVQSAFGPLSIVWCGIDNSVARIFLPAQHGLFKRSQFRNAVPSGSPPGAVADLCRKMERLLEGAAVDFDLDIMDWSRTTPFQERVLRMESRIPRGMVSTYGRLAAKLRQPHAARAVGTALARNPFPLVIPCHRTVRNDRSLGGYAGGLKMKKRLLELEGVKFDGRDRVAATRFW